MIPVTTFKDKRVAVFGLGGSGLTAARALVAGGAHVTAWDDAPAKVEAAEKAGVPVADLSKADWAGFAALVLTPGVPLTHPKPHWTVERAKMAGVEIIGDIELFVRERRAHAQNSHLVAITGTNGKSTTTALTAHLLHEAGFTVGMGGNIGTPVLELPAPAPGVVHVLEVSSYQIDLSPTLDASVGVLLNLSEDHLDRHGDMAGYAAVKECLVARAKRAVVGVDDGFCAAIADRAEQAGGTVQRISVLQPVATGIYADGPRLMLAEGGTARLLADLTGIGSLRGAHNAQNAAAAAASVLALGVSEEALKRGLASFPGLAHRMEQVRRIGRVLFVNDSKATNVDAAARALGSFPEMYWIAGGRPKTGGIEGLAPFFPRIAKAYLIGEAEDEFARTLEGRVPYVRCGTLAAAVEMAARDAAQSAAPEPVVLLSPACASFDQYPNFEVRGDAFRALVDGMEEPKA